MISEKSPALDNDAPNSASESTGIRERLQIEPSVALIRENSSGPSANDGASSRYSCDAAYAVEIVQRCIDGDSIAQKMFCIQARKDIFQYIFRRSCGNQAVADDIAQNVLKKMLVRFRNKTFNNICAHATRLFVMTAATREYNDIIDEDKKKEQGTEEDTKEDTDNARSGARSSGEAKVLLKEVLREAHSHGNLDLALLTALEFRDERIAFIMNIGQVETVKSRTWAMRQKLKISMKNNSVRKPKNKSDKPQDKEYFWEHCEQKRPEEPAEHRSTEKETQEWLNDLKNAYEQNCLTSVLFSLLGFSKKEIVDILEPQLEEQKRSL